MEKPDGNQLADEAGMASDDEQEALSTGLSSGDRQVKQIVERGLLFALFSFFMVGLGLNLTPCVYPVIPITISFFSSQSEDRTSSRFVIALAYTLGIALVFTVLGLVSSLAGKQWGFLFQSPWFVIIISMFILAMAASMFGAFEIRIPSSLLTRVGQSRQGLIGALLMGMTVGIVIAPCAAGIIIGLVTLVAEQGLVFRGALYFFFMGLGLGLPYLVLATFSSFLTKMPRSGMWLIWIRKFFGVVLIGVAFYFIAPQAARIGDQKMFFIGLVTLFGGLYLGFLDQNPGYSKTFNRGRAIFGIIIALTGGMLVQNTLADSASSGALDHGKSPVNWVYYTNQEIGSLLTSEKPIIIDFYADWCAPCRSIDKKTFSNPDVIQTAQSFSMIKVDGTILTPEIKTLMKKFKVAGYPTMIFMEPGGKELANLRVLEYIGPEDMLLKMKTLLKKASPENLKAAA